MDITQDEFEVELDDDDVYTILKEMGIITDELFTKEEYDIWKSLCAEGYNEGEAYMIAKTYPMAKEIIDKNNQK